MIRSIPFSVVTKPTGAACNLDCQYCFFLSKELLYNAAAQTMSEQTLERYVEAFLESSPDGEVTISMGCIICLLQELWPLSYHTESFFVVLQKVKFENVY